MLHPANLRHLLDLERQWLALISHSLLRFPLHSHWDLLMWLHLLRCWSRPQPRYARYSRVWVRGLTRTGIDLTGLTGVRSWGWGAGYTLRDRLQVIPCWITAWHRLRKPPMEEGMAHC